MKGDNMKHDKLNNIEESDLGDERECYDDCKDDKEEFEKNEQYEDISIYRMYLIESAKDKIEKNRLQDVKMMYEEMMIGARPKDQEWLKKDMDKIMKYNFEDAFAEASKKEKNETFGFEYFYEKALRLKPDCQNTIAKMITLKEEVNNKDMSKLNRIAQKKEKYNQLSKESIASIYESVQLHKEIHTTVAMEGNSFTLDEVIQFLKTQTDLPNRSPHDHKEVLDAASAIAFANETLANNRRPIELKNILEIHHKVVEKSNPKIAGRMREGEVIVGAHMPPPFQDVPGLMGDFVQWLSSAAKDFHPIEVAARAHINIAMIHPFSDGNGRTSRLIMNIILQREGYPSIDIPMDRQADYYSSLQMTDDGYFKAFVRLVAECLEKTLDEYLNVREC